MDNITHSLVGIALADAASPGGNSPRHRRLLAGAGIIAANAPDFDLVYTAITPAPLGYLLHHRGHTHTVAGVTVMAILLLAVYRLLPPVRGLPAADRLRLWLVISLGLASHVPLDALNSYGVHPYHPVDSTWYYGDAVFIFEPWIWLVLGVAVAWNTRSRLGRLGSLLPSVVLPLVMLWIGIIPPQAFAVLALVALPFAAICARLPPRGRSLAGLTALVILSGASVAASREARAAATAALEPAVRGTLVDIALTPNPATPVCWDVIGIELDEPRGQYVLWRGTLSLAPGWMAPTSCASHRLARPAGVTLAGSGRLALRPAMRQPIGRLRRLALEDCRVRAWLRFGRTPSIDGGAIADLRFDRFGQNFTQMPLEPAPGEPPCPGFVPHWSMPRGDLLTPAGRQ